MTEINHIDCFSGPGGICTGFHAAGIKTIAAIEKVESCVETYCANHPEVNVIHKDIREVTEKDIKKAIGDKKIHIVTSGMPCETFSTAGASSRSSYDYRQQLYSEAIRIAKIVKAPLILFENVPAILTKKVTKEGERLIIENILDELKQNGYVYHIQKVLKATDFGVPQSRERFFLLVSNKKNLNLSFPEPSCNKTITVAEAFEGLPTVNANDPKEPENYISNAESDYSKLLKDNNFWKLPNPLSVLTYHKAPKHRPSTIERLKLIATDESLVDIFKKNSPQKVKALQKKKIIPKKWYIQRNKRLNASEPSKTITSHCLDELVHPTLNRALTVRECARLQGFPDNYIFNGPYIVPHLSHIQDKYEQIGDAVPPLMAYNWGKVIMKILIQNSQL